MSKEYPDIRALAESEMGTFTRLYITPHLNKSGANPYLYRLYAPYSEGTGAADKNMLYPLTSYQMLLPALRRLFKGERAIWHQHWLQFSSIPTFIRTNFRLLGSLLFIMIGGRILWTVHNEKPHVDKFVGLNIWYCDLFSRLPFRFHVHNQAAVGPIEKLYPVAVGKILVLHHPPFLTQPIPKEKARQGLLARYGVDTGGRRIFLMFGSIAPFKGFDAVVEIFRKLDPAKALLIIAGIPHSSEAEYTKALKAKADFPAVALFDKMIPEEDVNLFFCVADYTVFNHGRLNSSAMQLAHDYGCKIIAADLEAASVFSGEQIEKFSSPEELEALIIKAVD